MSTQRRGVVRRGELVEDVERRDSRDCQIQGVRWAQKEDSVLGRFRLYDKVSACQAAAQKEGIQHV
jgi:hypothetical protein